MPKIFICYRREDSSHQAGRLFDRLVAKYGPQDVFKDVDSIPLGVDFRQVLEAKVGKCDVLLALVGDQWLTAAKPGGGRRLDDPTDFVRIEIETALRRNIPVIPLLVGKASVPSVTDLPPSMQEFAYRNGTALRPDPDFHRDVDRLVQGIADVAAWVVEEPKSPTKAPDAPRTRPPTPSMPVDQKKKAPPAPILLPKPAKSSISAAPPPAIQPDRQNDKRKDSTALAETKKPKKRRPLLLWAGAGLGILLLGVVGAYFLATIMPRVDAKAGTVLLEIDEKDAEVYVDGDKITIGRPAGQNTITVTAMEGKHPVRVTKEGFEAWTDEITFRANEPDRVKIRLKRVALAQNPPKDKTEPPKKDAAAPKTLTVALGGGVTMEFVRIPAGSFKMGSSKDEAGREDDEVQHPVRISEDFYLGKYHVTQAQYEAIIGNNPSYFCASRGGKDKVAGLDTSQFPVDSMSWRDAAAFCDQLSARDPKRRLFRLPTEAEWEYACRGGTKTAFYFGNVLNGTQANCKGLYGTTAKGPYLDRPSRVGAYESITPHPWGLCDMHGNVWQWCQDWYDAGFYTRSTSIDPICTDGEQKHHVLRGGSFVALTPFCRAAYRGGRARIIARPDPDFGFRVAFGAD